MGDSSVDWRRRGLKAIQVAREETGDLAQLHRLGTVLTRPFPVGTLTRSRSRVLASTGWNIGHGTVFSQTPRLLGSGPLLSRLRVGCDVFVNVGNVWELSDSITIGDGVAVGHDVILLTSSHRIGNAARRADALFTEPIAIGDGVWIGARAMVLPGVAIGSGALVAANTIVRHDVPPNVLFAGNPGRVVRRLDTLED